MGVGDLSTSCCLRETGIAYRSLAGHRARALHTELNVTDRIWRIVQRVAIH